MKWVIPCVLALWAGASFADTMVTRRSGVVVTLPQGFALIDPSKMTDDDDTAYLWAETAPIERLMQIEGYASALAALDRIDTENTAVDCDDFLPHRQNGPFRCREAQGLYVDAIRAGDADDVFLWLNHIGFAHEEMDAFWRAGDKGAMFDFFCNPDTYDKRVELERTENSATCGRVMSGYATQFDSKRLVLDGDIALVMDAWNNHAEAWVKISFGPERYDELRDLGREGDAIIEQGYRDYVAKYGADLVYMFDVMDQVRVVR